MFSTKSLIFILFFGVLFVSGYKPDESSSIPQQIHLSFGRNPLEIVVTWTTYVSSDRSIVQFSAVGQKNHSSAYGQTTQFVDGGDENRVHYIHRVLITGLRERTVYEYRCGCHAFWSGFYSFKTFTLDKDASSEVLIFGDLGLNNGESIPSLRKEVLSGKIDAIIHVGDIAYDMDTDNSRIGDEFMRVIQPIAAYLPYQVCAGNHEQKYNFSNYDNRFTMFNMFGTDSGTTNNWFYSFYMGPVMFIGFTTEFYGYFDYGTIQMQNQYRWLEETLSMANKPEHRSRWPWIITFAHRPMYCSNLDTDDCTTYSSPVRIGFGPEKKYPLEKLFFKYGVDLEIWAHEHSYERLFPIFDTKVYNGTSNAYVNPGAPAHIITGAAGCQEFIDEFYPKPKEWSAIRVSDYGYTRMNIINRTHIRIRQISDVTGETVDDFTMVKDYHEYY